MRWTHGAHFIIDHFLRLLRSKLRESARTLFERCPSPDLLSHSTRLDTNLTRATTRYEDTNKRRRANVWHGALPLYFECGVQGQNQATSATTPRELELLVVCNSEHEAYIESTHAEQLMYVLRARFTNAFSCSSRACVEKLERMPHATRRDATVKTNANANDEREPQTKRRRFRGGAHSAAYS